MIRWHYNRTVAARRGIHVAPRRAVSSRDFDLAGQGLTSPRDGATRIAQKYTGNEAGQCLSGVIVLGQNFWAFGQGQEAA